MNLIASANFVTILGGITSFIVVAIVVYLYAKSGSNQVAKESNDILRGLVDDQKEEILKLRQRLHDLTNQLTGIQLKVEHLAVRRDYLEGIMITALRAHFSADPTIADTVKQTLEAIKTTEKEK